MNKCCTTYPLNENKDDLKLGSNGTLFPEYTPTTVQKLSERVYKEQTAIPKQRYINSMYLNHENQSINRVNENDHVQMDTTYIPKNLKQKDLLQLIRNDKRQPKFEFEVEKEIMNAIKSDGKNNIKLTNKY